MPDWLLLPIVIIGYVILMKYVLPRLGVPT